MANRFFGIASSFDESRFKIHRKRVFCSKNDIFSKNSAEKNDGKHVIHVTKTCHFEVLT